MGWEAVAFFLATAAFATPAGAVTTIQLIGFRVQNGQAELSIDADAPFTVTSQENAIDKQIVLEIAGAKLSKAATRKLDTTSFNSAVKLVSPYQVVLNQENTVRVVIQMREMTSPSVVPQGNKLLIGFGGVPAAESPQPAPEGASAASTAPMPEPVQPSVVAAPAVDPNLAKVATSQKTKQFTGKPVTLQVRDADVQDVLRLIGEASGFNIVIGPGVAGKLTLSLIDVPWDQALDIVLSTLKLGAERNHNVLRVVTLADLTAEKQAQQVAKLAQEAAAPRITRLFPISYANPDEMLPLLKDFGKSGPGGSEPQLKVDKRTNSILAQDITDNLDRMSKIVELLDTQTPQVLIEAKVVEASENFSRDINGRLGFGDPNEGQLGKYTASFNAGEPIADLITPTSSLGSGGNAGSFNFSPVVGFIPGVQRLNAFLAIGESEQQVKIVTSPRTVVLNKEKADISQSIPVAVFTSTFDPDTNATTTAVSFIEAKINLGVTANVTNDESVLLDLDITRDVPLSVSSGANSATGVGKRSMKTKVLVENGSTLVIGGIYLADQTESEGGFPFLRKIPLIGWLFGNQSSAIRRSELFFFVTPKILNRRAAGFTDQG